MKKEDKKGTARQSFIGTTKGISHDPTSDCVVVP